MCVAVQLRSNQNGSYSSTAEKGTKGQVLEREKELAAPSKAAAQAELAGAASHNGTGRSSNGTGGATPATAAAARASNGAAAPRDAKWSSMDSTMPRVEGDMDPCDVGQMSSCANLQMSAREKAALEASTSDVRPCSLSITGCVRRPVREINHAKL